jgi:hypothetical protein
VTRRRLGIAGFAIVVTAAVALVVAGTRLLGGGGGTPTEALGTPHFVDATTSSGVAHTYGDSETAMIGGGVAVLDCDDDGRPDLFLAGAGNPSALYRNQTTPGGDLAFIPVEGGLPPLTDVMGAYPLDIDGDGRVDLAVLRVGSAELLRGRGDCRFESANEAWSLSTTPTWKAAFSATWEGAAFLPTLAVGGYVGLDEAGNATYTCPDNELFRPNAAGSGYDPAIALSPGYCSLSMLFSDWDGSGRKDLRVSNDRQYYDDEVGQEQLWRMEAGKAPRLYTSDEGWVLVRIWGMGIASYDVTGDALPDIYLTSQGPNKLQTLLSGPDQPSYRDIALKRGVVGTRPSAGDDPLPSTAWHPEFQDVNNDGFIDLYVSKGNVGQQPDYAVRDPSDLFIGKADGTFTASAEEAGILDFEKGRGAAVVDLDLDGLLDVVQVDLDAPVRVWRNLGSGTTEPAPMGHWLGLRLHQPGPNRDAIGAQIDVRVGETVLRRELTVGGGHEGGQLGWTHVGLGPATTPEVRVTWPDGDVGPWIGVAPDQFLTLDRASSAATPWDPRSGATPS